MTVEGPRHGPFKLKDQSDGFMEPLAGRLPFQEIIAMDEAAIDKRLAEHLKGQPAFIDEVPRSFKDKRKLEIKKIFLAVLEGYQPGGKAFADWFERMEGDKERSSNVNNYIGKIISDYASEAYRERRLYNKNVLLFESELMSPRPEAVAQLQEINKALGSKGLGAMSLGEILLPIPVLLDEPEVRRLIKLWTVNDLLKLFYLTIQGERSDMEIADTLGMERSAISKARSTHFTKEAKDAMRRARGFDPIFGKSRK